MSLRNFRMPARYRLAAVNFGIPAISPISAKVQSAKCRR
jgi:hypothetical protein